MIPILAARPASASGWQAATRYDKLVANFLFAVCLAAVVALCV